MKTITILLILFIILFIIYYLRKSIKQKFSQIFEFMDGDDTGSGSAVSSGLEEARKSETVMNPYGPDNPDNLDNLDTPNTPIEENGLDSPIDSNIGSPELGYVSPGMGYASPGMGYASPGMGYASPGMGYASPGLSFSPSPSFSPSSSLNNTNRDIDLKIKFSLNLNYDDYIKDMNTLQNFKNNIQDSICKLLEISEYRTTIDHVTLGTIGILMTFKKTKYNNHVPIMSNDNIYSNQLYELFLTYLLSINDDNSILKFIDKNSITIDKKSHHVLNPSNIIPKQLSFIENLINSNQPFKMYTLLSKEGIYPKNTNIDPLDSKLVKLYLTVNNKENKLSECTFDNGLIELREENEITINSVFKLSAISPRSIVKENIPFKYIDYNHTSKDKKTKKEICHSQFYNLQLYNTSNSITYCAEGCENKKNDSKNPDNITAQNGFCAQNNTKSHNPSLKNGYLYEKIIESKEESIDINKLKLTINGLENNNITKSSTIQSIKPHKLEDTYNIKNYMKLKIEDEKNMIVTPYWISKNPIERIYFITNKYNILGQESNYKKIIQVPKYIDESKPGSVEKPYYEKPVYINDSLVYEKELITDINSTYSSEELNNIKNKKSVRDIETLAFKNSAYQLYSLQFYIEPINNININKLPKN